ncbi:MAG: hypothetical protein CMF35_09925 [Leeuwenhoekiella sp.]|nr:hypothetical protein [Leeuwenhoekiella sp.]
MGSGSGQWQWAVAVLCLLYRFERFLKVQNTNKQRTVTSTPVEKSIEQEPFLLKKILDTTESLLPQVFSHSK